MGKVRFYRYATSFGSADTGKARDVTIEVSVSDADQKVAEQIFREITEVSDRIEQIIA